MSPAPREWQIRRAVPLLEQRGRASLHPLAQYLWASVPQSRYGDRHHPAIVFLFGAFLLIYVGIEASVSHWAYSVQTIARATPPLWAGYGLSAYWLGLTAGRFLLSYSLRSLGGLRTITLSLGLLMIGLIGWWQQPQSLIQSAVDWLCASCHFPHNHLADSQTPTGRHGSNDGWFCNQCSQCGVSAHSGRNRLGCQWRWLRSRTTADFAASDHYGRFAWPVAAIAVTLKGAIGLLAINVS